MNLVFMSDTLTPDKKEDVDLLPFNSYSSGQFFEYTRLDNDLLRDKNYQVRKGMLLFMILLMQYLQWKT